LDGSYSLLLSVAEKKTAPSMAHLGILVSAVVVGEHAAFNMMRNRMASVIDGIRTEIEVRAFIPPPADL
jgi:hypothetical protein